MINATFRLIQPDPEAHLQPIAQLAAEAFTDGQYVTPMISVYTHGLTSTVGWLAMCAPCQTSRTPKS